MSPSFHVPSVRKPFSSGMNSTSSLGLCRRSSKSRRNRLENKPKIEGMIAERRSICAKTVKAVIRARRCRTAFRAEHEHHQQHWGPSGVCGARLCDCREIGSGDLRLQVLPDSICCFVVAPFDVLALRYDECGHAATGGGWPGHPVSLAYDFRLEQLRVLPGENFSGNLPERRIRLRDRIAVAASQPRAVLRLCRSARPARKFLPGDDSGPGWWACAKMNI